MPGIKVKIDTRPWRLKVRKFTRKVHNNIDREIQATAFEIDRGAKKGVRVDTGRLRSSIHPQFKGTTAFQYADEEGGFFDGFLQLNLKMFEAIVGTNVEYAQKIEKADPFLEPAARQAKANFQKRMKNIFR